MASHAASSSASTNPFSDDTVSAADSGAERPTELSPEALIAFLRKYGYNLADGQTWKMTSRLDETGVEEQVVDVGTQLELDVTGHEERDGHTWYNLDCALGAPGARRLHWRTRWRLAELRARLHDPVKAGLGATYDRHFATTPFAHKGGLPGTTARLKSWCVSLAACLNAGDCSPQVCGQTLWFFDPPEPPSMTGSAKASVSGAATNAADKLRGAMGRAKDNVQRQAEQVQTNLTETASATAVGMAKKNPQMAQAASGAAMGYAKQNPEFAKSAGQLGGKTAFGLMKQNPKMAMNIMKVSARGAAKAM